MQTFSQKEDEMEWATDQRADQTNLGVQCWDNTPYLNALRRLHVRLISILLFTPYRRD